jgi:hypothetical protein
MRPIVTAALGLFVLCSPAMGWSNKEHIQLTRIAAMRLIQNEQTPAAMKQWLRQTTPGLMDIDGERAYLLYKRVGIVPRDVEGLPYWATMPDMITFTDHPNRTIAPYGVHERRLHFLDVEYFNPDEEKRSYRHDLSHKPRLADFPREISDERYRQAGMLPFRIEECYRMLVEQLLGGRLDDRPGQYPRDEHAARWAGYLAHYVQDNTQPHHATIDYRSAAYFAEGRRAPNVHAEMEYRMVDDDREDFLELRREFWELFVRALDEMTDPVETDDPWQATIEVALISYDALPLIGLAAMEAAGQGGTPEQPAEPPGRFDTGKFMRYRGSFGDREMTVMEMKARQMAWAVIRTERLWRQAWDEAHAEPGT